MKPQFVTAIYTGLEGTRFNGNAQGGIYDRYKQSLRSLAAGGYGIVCFTAAAHMDELTEYYKDYPNLTLVQFELSEYHSHAEIEAIKDLKPKYITEDSWRSRCVEIMWGKFHWLHKVIRDWNLEEDDSIFWIDAGIFHGGLISNTMRSAKSKDFYDFDTITQDRNLYDDLVKYADGKVINIRSQQVNHGSDDYYEHNGHRPEYGICAGIFGGKKNNVFDYTMFFTLTVTHLLRDNILLKEEEIMYLWHSRYPDKFKTFEFNNWYHEDWGSPLYDPAQHVSFSDFFKVIRE